MTQTAGGDAVADQVTLRLSFPFHFLAYCIHSWTYTRSIPTCA